MLAAALWGACATMKSCHDKSALQRDRAKRGTSMKKGLVTILAILVLGSPLLAAESIQTGKIIRWESEAYSQNDHETRNRVVYYVQGDSVIYKITPRHDKARVKMEAGEAIHFRIKGGSGKHGVMGRMYLTHDTGKETEFDIIGESR